MLRIGIILAIFLIISVSAISSIQTSDAQSNVITLKHWFITSNQNGCSSGNIQALAYYETLTLQYLSKYDIHLAETELNTNGKCVMLNDVLNNIENFEEAMALFDLPIVILDTFSGLDYLLTQDRLGHYEWRGDSRVIVFASLSPFIESDSGGWILSHELSHFATHFNGYQESIIIDWVHQIQTKSEDCLGEYGHLNHCPELWTTVKAPSGKNIKMMAIYDDSESVESYTDEDEQTPLSQAFAQLPDAECFTSYLNTNYNDAIQCYENYLDSNPTDTDAMAFLGRSYEGANQKNDALKTFQNIVDLEPTNTQGLAGVARVSKDLGQCNKAYEFYTVVLGIDPTHIEAKTFVNLIDLVCPLTAETFDIKPILSNGWITNYEFNIQQHALTLRLTDVGDDAEMQVHLPRELIDAKEGNQDLLFEVAIDTKRVIYDEKLTTSSERVLSFSVPSDSNWVKISGTESHYKPVVVPEFHQIAIMVLGFGIIGIIILNRKSRFFTSAKIS